jgi:hypothetical protein
VSRSRSACHGLDPELAQPVVERETAGRLIGSSEASWPTVISRAPKPRPGALGRQGEGAHAAEEPEGHAPRPAPWRASSSVTFTGNERPGAAEEPTVSFAPRHDIRVATYRVNPAAVARAEELIDARQYVLRSEWNTVQPRADQQNAFLERHSWEEYARWHLGLTEGAADETKARHAFVYGDFRRVHRMGLIACHYRAAEWRHKEIELAAHDLLQRLDAVSG